MPTDNLPENNDASYPDDPERPDIVAHQQHHDRTHRIVNRAAVVSRWDSVARTWEVRPSWAPWGVIFDASNDSTATLPPSTGLQAGDTVHLSPTSSLLSGYAGTKLVWSGAAWVGPAVSGGSTTTTTPEPRAIGKLLAGLSVRKSLPCRVVFVGSSTPAGIGASTAALSVGALIISALQKDYPSGLGTETATQFSTTASFGTLSTAAGVHGYSAGISSTTSANYLTATTRASVAALAPRAIIHMIGSNDMSDNMSPATFKANMLTQINDLKSRISTPVVQILLHTHYRLSATAPAFPWASYGTALAEIAAADPDNVAFVDGSVPFTLAGVRQNGPDPYNLVGSDNIHLTDPGHALLADAACRGIGINPPSSIAGSTTPTPPPPAGTTISADDFNRTAGSALGSTVTGGFAWTTNGGTWAITNNAISNTGTTAGTMAVINDGQSEGTFSVTAAVSSAGVNNCGLFFSGTAANTGYCFFYSTTTASWRLINFAAGTVVGIATGGSTPAAAAGQVLSVVRVDDRIVCKVGGTIVIDAIDGTYHGTFHGVYAAAVARDFDNWSHTSTVDVPISSNTVPANTVAMPTTSTKANWAYSFGQDFTTTAALGQFQAVYGTNWNGINAANADTSKQGSYRPAKSISVENSRLHIRCFYDAATGEFVGANPYVQPPAGVNGGSQEYASMRASIRYYVTGSGSGWKAAWLLWSSSYAWADGEIDMLEGALNGDSGGFSHPTPCYENPSAPVAGLPYCGNNQLAADYGVPMAGAWHTATMEWVNKTASRTGSVEFFHDGVSYGRTTTNVPSKPMHWQLQTETWLSATPVPQASSWDIYVDWLTVETWTGP